MISAPKRTLLSCGCVCGRNVLLFGIDGLPIGGVVEANTKTGEMLINVGTVSGLKHREPHNIVVTAPFEIRCIHHPLAGEGGRVEFSGEKDERPGGQLSARAGRFRGTTGEG